MFAGLALSGRFGDRHNVVVPMASALLCSNEIARNAKVVLKVRRSDGVERRIRQHGP